MSFWSQQHDTFVSTLSLSYGHVQPTRMATLPGVATEPCSDSGEIFATGWTCNEPINMQSDCTHGGTFYIARPLLLIDFLTVTIQRIVPSVPESCPFLVTYCTTSAGTTVSLKTSKNRWTIGLLILQWIKVD